MYTITKRYEIAGAHHLCLNYDSPCERLHGHNWIVNVEVKGKVLNQNGMLIDFGLIKNVVTRLDHQEINKILGNVNPTAENICRWIALKLQQEITEEWALEEEGLQLPHVSSVTVQESEGNIACYTP